MKTLLMLVLAVVPATGQAQDVKTFLSGVAKAMGTENLKTLQYSGTGSIYIPVAKGNAPAHQVMKRYVRHMDLQSTTSDVEITQSQVSAGDQTQTRVIRADSPWSEQYDFWITPYGFLKGALTYDAKLESGTVFGEHYKVVSFTLPNNHKVSAFINDQNVIAKIQTSLETADGDVIAETVYRDYTDFGGLKFPTTIFQKRADSLSMVLVVNDVKPNGV